MRTLIATFTAVTLAWVATAGAAAPADRPSTGPATQPATAATPLAALEQLILDLSAGDEQTFRSHATIRSPDDFVDAYSRRTFASARLNRVVAERRLAHARVRTDDSWDRADTLPFCVPPAELWKHLLTDARNLAWQTGEMAAYPVGKFSLTAGFSSVITAERVGNGWSIVVADPGSGNGDWAKSLDKNARAFDAVAARVEAGELRTVGEVNDVLFPPPKRKVRAP